MSKHKEITFETEIIQYLTQQDWIEGCDQDLAILKERRTDLISSAITGKIDVRGEIV